MVKKALLSLWIIAALVGLPDFSAADETAPGDPPPAVQKIQKQVRFFPLKRSPAPYVKSFSVVHPLHPQAPNFVLKRAAVALPLKMAPAEKPLSLPPSPAPLPQASEAANPASPLSMTAAEHILDLFGRQPARPSE